MLKLNIQMFGGRGASSSINGNSNWNKLKKMFPNGVVTDGINQVQIMGRENAQKVWDMMEREGNKEYRNAQNTTLAELNEAPIVLTTFGNNDVYMNIYKNRKDLFNSVTKEYGGFSQITGGDKNTRYSISSLIGNGEFYLERYKYAKGGWRWMDGSNSWVEGYTKQWKKMRER